MEIEIEIEIEIGQTHSPVNTKEIKNNNDKNDDHRSELMLRRLCVCSMCTYVCMYACMYV